MARILVSGASGMVGTPLVKSLKASGAQVSLLVRGTKPEDRASGDELIPWDPGQPLSPEAVSGFDAAIHLAGESIMGRWTPAKKARILDSRRLGTSTLATALAHAQVKPQLFLSASAIGFYGSRGDEVLNEESLPGTGFAAEVSRVWEAATQPAVDAGIRTVRMRIGVVMSDTGGALKQMLLPFKLGLGGRIGNGRQWMSWIDLQDIIGAIHHLLKSDLLEGPVNLVSPRPVTNAEFTKTLASVLSRPAIFPVPAFAARLAFGEMADELLMGSQRIEPAKLVASGYPFRSGDLRTALEGILKKS